MRSEGPRTEGGSPPRRQRPGLDTPRTGRRPVFPTPQVDPEVFGRVSERFARYMGTARFLAYMTVMVIVWLVWNTFAPAAWQFDPRGLNYTLLTLLLSLQASYAAPLILLAQNRQDDRDRVALEQDRHRAEHALADTEYLAREVTALRIALRDVATRDFLRSELRDLMEELSEQQGQPGQQGRSEQQGQQGRTGRPMRPPTGSGDGSPQILAGSDGSIPQGDLPTFPE